MLFYVCEDIQTTAYMEHEVTSYFFIYIYIYIYIAVYFVYCVRVLSTIAERLYQ